jgi:hypothetical protein
VPGASLQRVFPSDFFECARLRVSFYLVVYSLIPPLVGAVAATALYVVFAGELVTGSLFPKFHLFATDVPDPFRNFVANWQPMSEIDHAKALLWGFVAGFSERFVPDLLTSLGAKAKP